MVSFLASMLKEKMLNWFRTPLISGLAFTAFQISIALILAPHTTEPLSQNLKVSPPAGWMDSIEGRSAVVRRYLHLNNWDSLRYFEIAQNGYHTPPIETVTAADIEGFRSNCAFFPGYPIVARAFSSVFGTSIQIGLLGVTHLFTFVFWVYFISLLELWNIERRRIAQAAVLVLAFPTSFYMVMGYSESLFLACMLGMIFWFEKGILGKGGGRRFQITSVLAGLHGFGMTSVRLMGAPLVVYPLLRALGQKIVSRRNAVLCAMIVGGLTVLGCGSFFLFCQLKFGHWNLYALSGSIGWNITPQPWAMFNPLNYIPYYFFENTEMSLDRSIPPMVILGLWWIGRGDCHFRERIGLYLSVLLMHALLMTAKSASDQIGMARHGFTPFILLMLTWLQSRSENGGRSHEKYKNIIYLVIVLVFFCLQFYLTFRFLRGKWVE